MTSGISVLSVMGGLVSLALFAPAQAASLEIKNVAATVVIIPEARSDVSVEVIGGDKRLALKQTQSAGKVILDGGVRNVQCTSKMKLEINDWSATRFRVSGLGSFDRAALPKIIAHVPLDAKISASGAVFGSIGRTHSLSLDHTGCGDWTLANVEGALNLSQAGSGDTKIGTVGSAEVQIAGSGDVSLVSVAKGLGIEIAGSGDVVAQTVDGPLTIEVAGSGDVDIKGGAVSGLDISIAGSGDVNFGGTAASGAFNIAGSGDISIHKVTGAVSRSVMGSGDISIGE
jgi:acyl dehydratase